MIPLLSTAQMRDADALAVAKVAGPRPWSPPRAPPSASRPNRCWARVTALASRSSSDRVSTVPTDASPRRGCVRVAPKSTSSTWRTSPRRCGATAWSSTRPSASAARVPTSRRAVEVGTLVLAVDLPSGVDSDTGALLGSPMSADVTLALGALKPAHVTGPAAAICGQLRFAGLGIVQRFDDGLMEDSDLGVLVQRETSDHKWTHAIQVLAGSTLMPGAADLVVRGALAAGASMIRLSSRGDVAESVDLPAEVVRSESTTVEPRARCVVAGPGLGTDSLEWLRERLGDLSMPVVLDADGLDRVWSRRRRRVRSAGY